MSQYGPYGGGGFVPGPNPQVSLPPYPANYPYPSPYPPGPYPPGPYAPPPFPPPQAGYFGPMGFWPVPPPPPRVWPCFVAVACVFVAHIVVGILVAIIVLSSQGRHNTPMSPQDVTSVVAEAMAQPNVFLAIMGAAVMLTLAGGVVPAGLSPVPFSLRVRLIGTRTRWWQDVLLVIAALGVSWALSALVTALRLHEQGALADLNQSMSRMDGAHLVLTILIVGIIGPVAEEILFRGYVQTRLKQRWGALPAVLITSVLFGLLHFDLIHSAFAFGLGLVLGYLTERSGSIWPAVWVHAINNTSSVLSSALKTDPTAGREWLFMACFATAAILCIAVVELTRPRAAPAAAAAA